MACPQVMNLSSTTDSCEWNQGTDPHYHANMAKIRIAMNGTNYLQPSGVLWYYEIDHWEIGKYVLYIYILLFFIPSLIYFVLIYQAENEFNFLHFPYFFL